MDAIPASSWVAGLAAPTLSVVVPCYNERANVAPMVERLGEALAGISWEALFVDDDSPDGTAAEVRRIAQSDIRVRCIRRIGRRGLASAVIEGALASSAQTIVVIDGDLQHDPAVIPQLLAALNAGADIAVGSRHVQGGDNAGLANARRRRMSDLGIKAAQMIMPAKLEDPMSGFFALRRETFDQVAPKLHGQGFKILLDIVLAAPSDVRLAEVPMQFHPRLAGESKLDILVVTQFAGLLLDKLFGGLLPIRFVAFALVGALGLCVHFAILTLCRAGGLGFGTAQAVATVVAMVFNFWLNNAVTYRSCRLRGDAVWRGLAIYMFVCGLGAIANLGIANVLYQAHSGWTPSGIMGAAIGLVWNYAVSATLVWRAR